uniref:NADH-ubiquinone oxidoreductase chain 6 n=1 Tax=Metacarcinus magister TaxID=29965 RepID=A0A7G7WQD6_METMG|nr:NADH dehydrogenase subunit 6 [Metacarcinus magister]QNH68763.1 NADH dehydrogenase subunit 6 [Metacarcinus magister]
MTLLTIPIMLVLSFLFTRVTHPLSMGLILLIQTIMISLSAGTYTHSYWFSYVLFLIFLGGMLVLFIYVASLASNEIFLFSLMTFLIYTSLFLSATFLIMFLDPLVTSYFSLASPSSVELNLSTPQFTMWLYSKTSMNFTLFIISYLLLTLVVVIKIINLFKGPLRLSN